MPLRENIENLSVSRKLLSALLVLLATVLIVANLAFISAAYWITQQSTAPQALHTLGHLLATPSLSDQALDSVEASEQLLQRLDSYAPLLAAAIYDARGKRFAYRLYDEQMALPLTLDDLKTWHSRDFRASELIALPQADGRVAHLFLMATSKLPTTFYIGIFSASLAILVFSVLLWMLIAKQIKRLITQPLLELQALSHQVTRDEDYSLRARMSHSDEIGRLAAAFNTMLSRMQAREKMLKDAHEDAQQAFDQARLLAEETKRSNHKLELEVQVRSKIEKKLTNFQHYLNGIIDSMPSALIALDDELYVTQWNQLASELSGTSLDDAVNQPVFLAFPSLKPFQQQLKRTAREHKIEKVERVTWIRDGEPHHFALTMYPLEGDSLHGVVVRIDDITQRLSMEEIMVQSEKMMSVGGLAAGMAHEINNPLGAILHNVQNIRRRLLDDLPRNQQVAHELGITLEAIGLYLAQREVIGLLDGIQQAGSRAARIVSHMLSFSRMSHRHVSPCDLSVIADQALEIAHNDFDLTENYDFRDIECIRDYDARLKQVPGIATELEQVVLNLLKNAAQALYVAETQSPKIIVRTRLNGAWAEVQVEDNGPGIPEHIRKRIFEPFFTTKEVGQGTGLGLSVSYFIITNNHQGQMEVQSRIGIGTTFTLRLPLQTANDQEQ